MNRSLSLETANALRRFAFESTDRMKVVSEVAEKAIHEYLGNNGVRIEGLG